MRGRDTTKAAHKLLKCAHRFLLWRRCKFNHELLRKSCRCYQKWVDYSKSKALRASHTLNNPKRFPLRDKISIQFLNVSRFWKLRKKFNNEWILLRRRWETVRSAYWKPISYQLFPGCQGTMFYEWSQASADHLSDRHGRFKTAKTDTYTSGEHKLPPPVV